MKYVLKSDKNFLFKIYENDGVYAYGKLIKDCGALKEGNQVQVHLSVLKENCIALGTCLNGSVDA